MIRLSLPLFGLIMLGLPVFSHAAELSPWMGAAGQASFQLDPNTMVAVTFAADTLQTASTSKRNCDLKTCTALPLTAKTPVTNP